MSDDIDLHRETALERAKDLVRALEAGDTEAADNALGELAGMRDSTLFRELGKLTREFHEKLNSFRFDERFTDLAREGIPGAKDRLGYVIQMTDQAAHRTLTAVENSLPLCSSVGEQSRALQQQWRRFVHRDMTPQEFRELSKQLEDYFNKVPDTIDEIKTDLNDALMAQDFQDITGQIIRQVITLVDEVEHNLVDLVRLAGTGVTKKEKDEAEDAAQLDGPQVPGMESATAVSGQDEVDELLSSLGF